MRITIEFDPYEIIISENKFGVYGYGNNLREALQDFLISLIDYYHLTYQHRTRSIPDQMVFNQLSKTIALIIQ